MSDYQVLEMGGLDEWREHYGGFRPESSRDGRRVVDHDMTMLCIRAGGHELPHLPDDGRRDNERPSPWA